MSSTLWARAARSQVPRTAINAIDALSSGIDYTTLASTQRRDEERAVYRTAIPGLVLENVWIGPTDSNLLYNVSTGHTRPIIPAA